MDFCAVTCCADFHPTIIAEVMRKKNLLLLFCLAIPFLGWSQQMIKPEKNIVDKKWVKNQNYQMIWSAVKDTLRIPLATVDTQVEVQGDKILVITIVKMKSSASPWIDSTLVRRSDLSPIYHSSYNAQREMVLHFGDEVMGFYKNMATGETTKINESVHPGYFDSNFYPMLINWLPLKKNLKAEIAIFDYNPNGKTGLLKANILDVREGEFNSKKLGKTKIWIVEVSDEIGSTNGRSIYQIDQLTRQIYKQNISAGSRIMEMTLVGH